MIRKLIYNSLFRLAELVYPRKKRMKDRFREALAKKRLNKIIRMRLRFLEYVSIDKNNEFHVFAKCDARDSLKKLKIKHPYCWKTRNIK